MTSGVLKTISGRRFQIHWVENTVTGMRTGHKVKWI